MASAGPLEGLWARKSKKALAQILLELAGGWYDDEEKCGPAGQSQSDRNGKPVAADQRTGVESFFLMELSL